ncbi:FAD-dependent thymidylate synthase [Deferribacter thermophilus]|uniref:FAD-dependent thymidylate synthase n=1 Tax=Deferribacter thermophilus TaxID=53573 RepID=UPI003C2D4C9C
MNVKLLKYTAEPELTAALAAKLCYASDATIDDLQRKIERGEQESFIEKIVRIGHHSVLEHVSFTFGVEGVSRTLTHQLVRHRIASYSQRSQRYVKHKDGFEYVLPDSIASNSEAEKEFVKLMENISNVYDKLIDLGVPAEDARYVLPNACETKIIITMNARELLHFFNVRCCNRAQWEIRRMAEMMLEECLKVAPAIFKYAGPNCVTDKCKEGDFTCGKASEVRKRYEELLRRYDRLN